MIIIQHIIAYAILLAAFGITGYRIFRFFKDPYVKCNGCGSNCTGCPTDILKKALEEKNHREAKN